MNLIITVGVLTSSWIFHLFKFYDIADIHEFNHHGWCADKLMDISWFEF